MNTTLTAILGLSLTLGIGVSAMAEEPHNANGKPGVVLEEFVFDTAPFPSCHAATITEMDDGSLVCAFFGGTRERHPDVGIWVSRKEKGGGTWTPPVEVANGVQSAEVRYPTWNPVLFQPRDGELRLFYKVGPSPSTWWGMVTRSPDGGKTWSEPQKLGEGLIGPVKNKPIQLAAGDLVAGSSTEHDGWKVHVERSTDGGKTWQIVGPLNDPQEFSAIQPMLLTHPDGRIQMLCRTQKENVIGESWSSDDGKTWSPMRATGLPNNNSGLDGVTLADGRQLLVYNHSTRDQPGTGHKGRGILNVAVSRDGKQWNAALVLDHTDGPGKQFSYPAVIQSRDGLVHTVYTWHREKMKHVVIDPTKLVTKPIVDGKWPDNLR